MKEIFKSVINFPNYSVSNLGRVKNNSGIILKDRICRGYNRAMLSNGVTRREFQVHRLVYEAFNQKIPGNLQINHIDGNKLNNRIDNLECVTRSENMLHAFKHGLQEGRKGISNHRCKLTENQVREIRKLYNETGLRQRKIGEMFNVSQTRVHYIISGKNWSHLK